MKKFTNLSSHLVPLVRDNIDTDQIIPARFLKVTDKQGLGEKLFSDWRYRESGEPNLDFPLNFPTSQGAQILLAGHNFGSGSSREHAPWALVAWGFRVVVALSFADIFENNALKNGLLPVRIDAKSHAALAATVQKQPASQVTIDLQAQRLTLPDGSHADFPLEPFSKHCLVEGIDELEYILAHEKQIAAYEQQDVHG